MKYFENILDTIGNTPLVKLNKLVKEVPGTILAKVETTNPGNSVKDRMALQMIEDAEQDGRLKPGGTIVEGTSGNTGMGLALACIIKGYKLICTLNDKQSKEKMDILRAMGAEVIVCPTAVAADDPRSYYSVAKKIAAETPNSIYIDQYNNLSNRKAHYLTTGPEIWEQTDGKVTHFVVGVGTGGTISGVGKYLKEKNPNIKIWGIDTYGSVFKKYHETGVFDEAEIYPYITEGIGEDILPENVDFSLIDAFEKVTDKDAAVMTRRLAREEGIFVGNSAGAAVQGLIQLKEHFGPDDVVVVLFHDHGSRYVGKIFNDDWMRERGFLSRENLMAADLVQSHKGQRLIQLSEDSVIDDAIELLKKYNISQIPVYSSSDDQYVGSIEDQDIFTQLLNDNELRSKMVKSIMRKPFPVVEMTTPLAEIANMINKDNNAVLVTSNGEVTDIITKHDIISALK
ncbi:MAG: pyridoxal-phosphate dependent enzyme [Flavobacteriales bacterium]|nr:pyridoxal-phosphate dependent enzyme [Flavobacteriales bacterium]